MRMILLVLCFLCFCLALYAGDTKNIVPRVHNDGASLGMEPLYWTSLYVTSGTFSQGIKMPDGQIQVSAFNFLISTASASNGDCLKYDSGTGYWKPGACGGGTATTYLLLEDGTNLLLEDGTHLLTE